MHVNNRAGWKETFTVAASVLCSRANLTASTFKRARTELRDKEYIYYESQGGNRAAIYEIISSEQSTMSHSKYHSKNPSDQYIEPQTKERSSVKFTMNHKVRPLLKQKETKQITSTVATEAVHFFKENIGNVQPYIKNDLITWTNAIGEPLVLAAMKRALERGKDNWGYIKGILQDWLDKGFVSVKETEDEVLEFRNKQTRKARSSETTNQEVIPDWFHERNKKRDQKIETVAEAKEREELRKLVAAYADG